MGDVIISKKTITRKIRSFKKSCHILSFQTRFKLAFCYFLLSLFSVPARSGKQETRGLSPQSLAQRRKDLSDPVAKRKDLTDPAVRADFCRVVRRLIAKIRHQKNPVVKQESSEICTDRTKYRNRPMASVPQPQETWTNSWTCWTSGLMEEKDQSLDWDLTPTLTTTSNISLRLDQKQSGQFNGRYL